MRPIKFRAWDKYSKKIWTVESWEELTSKDIHIMQFTGLKDKNGKEIYEGDIVRVFYPFGQGSKIKTVGFACGSFSIGESEIWKFDNDVQRPEIIGNIYENGDLLK